MVINITEIAQNLNKMSSAYDFDRLIDLRKELRGLKMLRRDIFTSQTINPKYAFHNGGRRETQFNFGYEEERNLFRFGIAFSLEPSHTLPDPAGVFRSRIAKFNEYITLNKQYFEDMYIWAYIKGKPVLNITPLTCIDMRLVEVNSFIFIGKYVGLSKFQVSTRLYEEILETFDRLLPIYEYIESDHKSLKEVPKFIFKPGKHHRIHKTIKRTKASEKEIILKHAKMVDNVFEQFIIKYGEDNVSVENISTSGTSIDLVLRKKSSYIFYEFKTSQSLRETIREALSQLLEYSYYPSNRIARKLIIVSTNCINPECQQYLNLIRKDFNIPVYYQRYNDQKKILEDIEY